MSVVPGVGQEKGVNADERGALGVSDSVLGDSVLRDGVDVNLVTDVESWASLPNKGENFAFGVAYDCR